MIAVLNPQDQPQKMEKRVATAAFLPQTLPAGRSRLGLQEGLGAAVVRPGSSSYLASIQPLQLPVIPEQRLQTAVCCTHGGQVAVKVKGDHAMVNSPSLRDIFETLVNTTLLRNSHGLVYCILRHKHWKVHESYGNCTKYTKLRNSSVLVTYILQISLQGLCENTRKKEVLEVLG